MLFIHLFINFELTFDSEHTDEIMISSFPSERSSWL